MKDLFRLANQYIRESDWMDLARIKLCLCAVGILLGMQIPPKHRKAAALGAGVVFVATYLPLMGCFFALVRRERLKREGCPERTSRRKLFSCWFVFGGGSECWLVKIHRK